MGLQEHKLISAVYHEKHNDFLILLKKRVRTKIYIVLENSMIRFLIV